MRLARLAALAVLLVPALAAQTVPARGADDTFDVATWNLEFFGVSGQYGPSNDALQLSNVTAIMEQAGIDLWGLQEVVDTDEEWQALVDSLRDDGYSARLGPQVSGSPIFDQKLAFVYNTSVVQVVRAQAILDAYDYEFAGRLPFEMQARVTVDGVTRTVYVINFHAKAGTGSDDYARRVAAADVLKDYVDGRVARGDEVIVLGDFNDYLVNSTRGVGIPSPYDVFVEDAGYVAATLPLQENDVYTYCSTSTCSRGDTRDHLLFTSGLSIAYLPGSADRYGELLTAVPSYASTTSDHLPVLARFAFPGTDAAPAPADDAVALLGAAPSPFRGLTHLRFRLAAPSSVRLEVFDALGRRVASLAGAFGEGEHAVPFDGSRLGPGLYVVRLTAGGETRARSIVRAE